MHTSYLGSLVALTAAVTALPLEGRATGPTDPQILNYALTLEYLESTFYNETLAKFKKEDFTKAGLPDYFYGDLQEIASDEATHVSFLTAALKGMHSWHKPSLLPSGPMLTRLT